VIAYEPVWAIGTGKNAAPAQIEEIHIRIRSALDQAFPDSGDSLKILYGGSVSTSNAAALLAREQVDGALVGGASLDPASFTEICRAAAEA
jgi:triosephosphate isomerase